MPNHVQNKVEFDCSEEEFKRILEAIKFDVESESEDTGIGTFDFNKIIPMPESLDIESGSTTIAGIKLYLSSINPSNSSYGTEKVSEKEFKQFLEYGKRNHLITEIKANLTPEEVAEMTSYKSESELLALGKQAIENVKNHGATTWYDWHIANWGTKWNSYSPFFEDKTLYFQTAWSAPHPIMKKLSEMYPNITIQHQWADEDIGQNCGTATYKSGEMIDIEYPETDIESTKFALDVWGYEPEFYGFVINKANTKYINAELENYELIEVLGQKALFANERLTDADIPQGLHLAYLRESEDESLRFGAIEPEVAVNLAGTVITKEPIDFGENGCVEFTSETEPNFTGEEYTFSMYMEKDFSEDEEVGETLEQS